MANFFLFALRTENDIEFESIYQEVIPCVGSAFLQFYALVGQYSYDFSKCSVETFDTVDSSYIKKTRVLCGDVKIYVYLQKLF